MISYDPHSCIGGLGYNQGLAEKQVKNKTKDYMADAKAMHIKNRQCFDCTVTATINFPFNFLYVWGGNCFLRLFSNQVICAP